MRAGLSAKAKLFTSAGKQKLESLPLSTPTTLQRRHWLDLIERLNEQVKEIDRWLKQQAASDQNVTLLPTHPGIGILTSLALAHTLSPVSRFPNGRKVAAYLGLEPMEQSSGEKKRYMGSRKAGSLLMRHLIVEAAHIASRSDPQLKGFYLRLAKKKGQSKAIVAVARKLAIRSYRLAAGHLTNPGAEPRQEAIIGKISARNENCISISCLWQQRPLHRRSYGGADRRNHRHP